MALIETQQPRDGQALGGGHDRGIRQADGEIAVATQQFATTNDIRGQKGKIGRAHV